MFAVPNNQKCPVKVYEVYAEKRPAEMETNDAPFTLTVNNVKSGNNDVPQTDIMQLSGHKNVQSITRYSTVSQKQQLNMSHTLTGFSSGEIAPQSGSSIPEKRKHEFDELTYPTFRPTFSQQSKQAAQQTLSLFWGAIVSGGHIGVAINTLNQSPTLQYERKILAKLIKESHLLFGFLLVFVNSSMRVLIKSRVFRHIFRTSYFILTSSAF